MVNLGKNKSCGISISPNPIFLSGTEVALKTKSLTTLVAVKSSGLSATYEIRTGLSSLKCLSTENCNY